MVVREVGGRRVLSSITWGFPLRLASMKPDSKPKPVNNIADLRKGMWVGLARKPQWRCLIPVTSFAEAEGPKGAKTRTWFSVKDQPLFAWAGLVAAERGVGRGLFRRHDRLQRRHPAGARPHAGDPARRRA